MKRAAVAVLLLALLGVAACGSDAIGPPEPEEDASPVGSWIGDRDQLRNDIERIMRRHAADGMEAMTADDRTSKLAEIAAEAELSSDAWSLIVTFDESGEFRCEVEQAESPKLITRGQWTVTKGRLLMKIETAMDPEGTDVSKGWPEKWLTYDAQLGKDALRIDAVGGESFSYLLRRR